MWITTFKNTNLLGVNTERGIKYSAINGGCGFSGCGCSPGHWMCMSLGLVDGVVNVMTIHFVDKGEMSNFITSFREGVYDLVGLWLIGVTQEYIDLLKAEIK